MLPLSIFIVELQAVIQTYQMESIYSINLHLRTSLDASPACFLKWNNPHVQAEFQSAT